MARVLVPLADGFEEIEAITLIDVLRRAGLEVISAGLHEGVITASRGTRHLADRTLAEVAMEEFDLLVLPGGIQGVKNLLADTVLLEMLQRMHKAGKRIAAICAAPNILRNSGIIGDSDPFTAYPGSLEMGKGGRYSSDRVVRWGRVTTSTSAGSAFEFALDLVEQLCGQSVRDSVAQTLYLPFD
ncbi:DJ-1/PfpI family protein [candidate division KSB1 bacterium]|nr:DJ-1/PfpI family protein [candidate division KSB1 bacterium]